MNSSKVLGQLFLSALGFQKSEWELVNNWEETNLVAISVKPLVRASMPFNLARQGAWKYGQ